MKLPNPGKIGFSLPDYLGKMLRTGVKIFGRVGEGAPLASVLGQKFPTAEFGWVSTVTGWVSQGVTAMGAFAREGIISPAVSAITPIIPRSTFGIDLPDRFVMAGDFVSQDAQGAELERRLTTIGGWENSALEELMGKAIYELLQKIRSTNPEAADEFIDQFFEAHWLGRIF